MEVIQGEVERLDFVNQVEVAVRVNLDVLERACFSSVQQTAQFAKKGGGTADEVLFVRSTTKPSPEALQPRRCNKSSQALQ